ncbi:sigma-54-dependent Fis family transcriptional regulator [Litoribacter ruber]|uniref:sigma-54-dependent transcriptional regulator n=1 Tax=Litoribacter ruber TaxID=702568 RepID=UPI001BD922A4|nr:sigma-54 dependent transcriptional regulator [Litoribacter ruber]MBT0813087.1 sigma-54-dependent Fis family transcriptional regulator [Litoribacter ruber]
MSKILIIDDELSTCNLLDKFLTKKGYDVSISTQGKQAISQLKEEKFDLVICDYRLGDMDGSQVFEEIKIIAPETVVVFITGYVNLRVAVDLIKGGAYHYLAKPLNPDELISVIEHGLSQGNDGKGNSEISKQVPKSTTMMDYVYGESEASKKMIQHVKLVGPTNYTVIIEGETGTGKESLARLIHMESSRRDKPFMAIDCGSLSKEIAASELFGHEKGAFTGATCAKTGVFEMAEGGTVFLDEIANLSLDIQMALLRALQEKVIRRVGSLKEIPVDVRIIVATNEDLFNKSGGALFREDLYYRLNEFTLRVPPLRERTKDLPIFIDYFLEKTSQELNKEKPVLSDEVYQYFKRYNWPGNVRELRNLIRRACLLSSSNHVIEKDTLPLHFLQAMQEKENATDNYLSQIHEDAMEPDLKSTAKIAESKRIMEVLKEVHYNKTKAAEILNINRKTLYSKLRMLNIEY